MLFRKKNTLEKTEVKKVKEVSKKEATLDFINASKEFEKARIGDIESSEKKAWRVAIGACVLAICAVVSIVFLMPLKEIQPYVIRVDNNTGATDIVTVMDTKNATYNEQVAKYFSSLYVSQLESYDWYTLQNQVDTVLMFSDVNMQNRIKNRFSMPNAPHKIYKDQQRVEVKINNVSIIDDKGLIQVRFTSKVVPVNGGYFNAQTQSISPEPEEKKYIATLGYEYVNVPTLDSVRLTNPLGFTVKSYRVDEDGI